MGVADGLWTTTEGEGPPIVLTNGGMGCGDYLAPVAAMLVRRARVVRWECRGCGRSKAGGSYELEETLADLDALRAGFGFESWIVGGHSAGADCALAYALRFPERTRAVLYLNGTGIQNDRSWKDAYKAGVAAGKNEPPFDVSVNLEVNRAANDSWRRFIREPDLLRRLAGLSTPVLFVQGAEDIRPSWPVEQIARLIPDGEYVEIDGADHWPWVRQPAELSRALNGFLDGLGMEGARAGTNHPAASEE